MKQLLTLILLSAVCAGSFAQKEMFMSQYMHNRFAINTAFAGSAETLSAMAAVRMQWAGNPESPKAQYLSMHAPLKNDNVALGLAVFNENVAIAKNTGLTAAYAYRVNTGKMQKLAFSISAGFYTTKLNWSQVDLIDDTDPAFGDNEALTEPVLGFGVSWYSNSFFVGFSTPDIFYRRSFNNESPSLELSEIDYLFTAGYLFPLSEALAVQPSFLLRMNPSGSNIADLSGTFIYNSTFLLGAAYRTNSELIAIAGWQATPQLMIAYSYDYPTGDLSNMSSGSHEISLKYNFGYKINTANPRFF